MGPLAVSTDGGGSARVPAAACGVLGLKPTLGRVPHESWPFHFSNNSSVALNTRTVEDMIEMLAIMSGPHPLDPWSRRPSSELDRSQVADGVSWLGDRRMLFIESPAGLTPDRDLLGVLDALLTSLAGAGAEVKRAPGDPTEFDPAMVVRFLTPNLVARARQMSPGKQAMLESPFRELVASSRYHPDAVDLQQLNLERSRTYERVESLLAGYDLILTPTVMTNPPLADRDEIVAVNGTEVDLSRWWSHLAIANMTGHPAISIPAGFTRIGLPVGLHAIGPWDGEQDLLTLAGAVAELEPWNEAWPS
jgi:aspartyl-tRNA(Asn)/glutamyl-tRNA(Gln) amidotransferase subunit A